MSGVRGADGSGVGVGEIEAGVRNADVIDDGSHLGAGNLVADDVFDLVAEACGVFDAGAGVGAHVQLELATVDSGEEVLPEPRVEGDDGTEPERDDAEEERHAEAQAEAEHAVVPVAYFFEVVLEGDLEADERVAAGLGLIDAIVLMAFEEVLGHGGDDGAREEVRGHHGEDDGFGERHEEVAGYASEEEHGDEDDADGEGGDEGGDSDLRGSGEDGVFDFLTLFEIAIDVFDLDGSVVDEDADGECEAAEGHDVDGLARAPTA